MKHKLRRLFAAVIAVFVVFSSLTVFAVTNNSDVHTEAEAEYGRLIYETEVEVDPLATINGLAPTQPMTVDVFQTLGVSDGNVDVPFTMPSNFYSNITLVMNLKYHDGSTGTVSVDAGGNVRTATVDGESHVVGRNLAYAVGSYHFLITGVKSRMTYVIRMYVP